MQLRLSPNEFSDAKDKVGLLKDDPDAQEFLSLNEVFEDVTIAQHGVKYSNESRDYLPNV